jgi:predicted nucleotidyltransferase
MGTGLFVTRLGTKKRNERNGINEMGKVFFSLTINSVLIKDKREMRTKIQCHARFEKLKDIFSDYPYIASAYLFGSHVSGEISPESDVDIAILLKKTAPRGRELIHAEDYLAYKIAKRLEVIEVDLIDINNKGSLFQHNVLRTGILIYDGDPAFRIKFETRTIIHFCDFEPTLRYIEKLQLQGRIERYARP